MIHFERLFGVSFFYSAVVPLFLASTSFAGIGVRSVDGTKNVFYHQQGGQLVMEQCLSGSSIGPDCSKGSPGMGRSVMAWSFFFNYMVPNLKWITLEKEAQGLVEAENELTYLKKNAGLNKAKISELELFISDLKYALATRTAIVDSAIAVYTELETVGRPLWKFHQSHFGPAERKARREAAILKGTYCAVQASAACYVNTCRDFRRYPTICALWNPSRFVSHVNVDGTNEAVAKIHLRRECRSLACSSFVQPLQYCQVSEATFANSIPSWDVKKEALKDHPDICRP